MLNKPGHKKRWQLLYAVAIVASLGLGVVLGAQQFSAASPLAAAQLLPAPKTLPEFTLENHRSEAVGVNVFRHRWSLVFFGFTSCPDFCPLELQKLAKLLNLMGAGDELQVVFVSVDPERDGQEKLANYVGFFHPQILGLRGSNLALANFAQFFGAAYDRSAIVESKLITIPAGINLPTNVGEQYQVNHSTRVFVVNPQGEFIGSFTSPYELEEMLSDMQKLMGR
ncbi:MULTISPECIES: SCO family protein [Cellvibrio]|uniref:Protein SCO1/2 n=1 Tax=Cellvibrio fibrivorans TaxID=126350 RepID=A0ABU1US97_9GAMM|nr:SCO family protein [Cellvibrio fibrivorans]MDR7088010.1 protein SCO1/2 [Cellvibrio fibrivorans]